MRGRRAAAAFLRVGVPAIFTAFALSREGLVSVQVLLAAAAVWIAGTLLWDFAAASNKPTPQWRGAWQIRRRRSHATSPPHRGLQATNLLVTNAVGHARAHAVNLRPKLTELAQHYFPLRHGFDFHRERARADAVLGDLAWLIADNDEERAPTVAELDRFLDVVLDEPGLEQSK